MKKKKAYSKFDPENELPGILNILTTKCKDEKSVQFSEEILSKGKLNPHPELSSYYGILAYHYSTKNNTIKASKWLNVLLQGLKKKSEISLELIKLLFQTTHIKEAKKASNTLYEAGSWPAVFKYCT